MTFLFVIYQFPHQTATSSSFCSTDATILDHLSDHVDTMLD